MRHVNRGPEPTELTRYRTSDDPNKSWEAFRDKPVVLERLREAQHDLCCYCTDVIRVPHVEHYRSQADHPDHQLDWTNLFACCDGGHGQHCDGSKADRDLEVLDPADHPERRLRFLADGTIDTPDPSTDRDLTILGLRHPTLVVRRRRVVEALILALRKPGRTWSRTQLERELGEWERRPQPFGQWVVAFLRKRLARS